jgi:Na+/proline symporter
MAADLLPAVAPGLVGLFIAALLASVMSSCDAFMIASSALFTQNLYRRFLVRDRPDRHYLAVGRLVSLLVVLSGLLFAYSLGSVVRGLEVFWAVQAMMAVPFWVGIYWRRATPAAAWAATLVSFVAWLLTDRVEVFGYVLHDFNARWAAALPDWMLWEGRLYLPWQMLFYMGAGLAAMVVVSRLTRPVAPERLERVYACLRTPVRPGEPETAPFTLPPGVAPAPRDALVRHPDFEIPRPSTVSIAGFAVAWAFSLALVGVFYWILNA